MKKRTLRNIIQAIYVFLFLNISFLFMENDYIEKWLEMIIFSTMFLIFTMYCYNNGLKTSREIYKEVQTELQLRNYPTQCRKGINYEAYQK